MGLPRDVEVDGCVAFESTLGQGGRQSRLSRRWAREGPACLRGRLAFDELRSSASTGSTGEITVWPSTHPASTLT
jgi:hypothetical protein